MDIIKAAPADAALIAPLFDAYRVFYGQASNLALAEEFIAERLANNESVILLAVDSRRPKRSTGSKAPTGTPRRAKAARKSRQVRPRPGPA